MNEVLIESNPPMSGKSILLLRDQISSAFTLPDLNELVLLNFNQELEKIISFDERPLDDIVLSIIKYWNNRGTMANLLRSIVTARPNKLELVNTIAKLCPSAMHDPLSDNTTIEVVTRGVDKLDEIRKDANSPTEVKDQISASRVKIRVVLDGLNEFKSYKYLHDALQRAQLGPYRQLASQIDNLKTNPEIVDDLQLVVAQFKTICDEALQWVDGLSEDQIKYVREKEWADELVERVESVGTALGENKYRIVLQKLMNIHTLLSRQQPHLNDEMRSCVERLQLQNLVQLLQKIAAATELSEEQRPALADAKEKMELLWDSLHGRVAVHSKWQDVETQLLAADSASAKIMADSGEEFEASWQNARERIEPLWRQDPAAVWVVNTQRFSKRVDDALEAKPADLDSVRANYGRFSANARQQFQAEDTKLKGLCEKLLRLSDPLLNLLTG